SFSHSSSLFDDPPYLRSFPTRRSSDLEPSSARTTPSPNPHPAETPKVVATRPRRLDPVKRSERGHMPGYASRTSRYTSKSSSQVVGSSSPSSSRMSARYASV